MDGFSRETQMSIATSSMFPGFRFSPTDVELISYYLKKKMDGLENCVEVISEVEICKFEPWELPDKAVIKSDNEWFFFNSRGRKYPNGSQSKRATQMGYWKATGKERSVKSGNKVIGTKRTLVFHIGRAPKGERTEWIMHEYCMDGKSQDSLVVCRLRKNTEFRLNCNSNRATLSGRMHNNNYAVSEGGADQTGISDGEKGGESSSPRKYASSHGSYSFEQLDSASEAEIKLLEDSNLTPSSIHQKDSEGEEDCYADILNDDIIKLDDSCMPTTLIYPPLNPTTNYNPDKEKKLQFDVVEVPSQKILPMPQGTTTQRIFLRKQNAGPSRFREKEKPEEKQKEHQINCLITEFPTMALRNQIWSVLGVFTLLVVALYLFRGCWPVTKLLMLAI